MPYGILRPYPTPFQELSPTWVIAFLSSVLFIVRPLLKVLTKGSFYRAPARYFEHARESRIERID